MLINLDEYGEILSVKDVCHILGIGANNAYKLLADGSITNFKIGSVRKIPKQCLCDFVERMSNIHTPNGENNTNQMEV